MIGDVLAPHGEVEPVAAPDIGALGQAQEKLGKALFRVAAAQNEQMLLGRAEARGQMRQHTQANLGIGRAQPFKLTARIGAQCRLGDGFRAVGMLGKFHKAHQIAGQMEIGNVPFAVGRMPAKPNGSADDLVEAVCDLAFTEDRLVARKVLLCAELMK